MLFTQSVVIGATQPGGTSTEWECAAGTRSPRESSFLKIQHAMKNGHRQVCFLLLRNSAYTGCATQRFIACTMAISSAANTSTRANGAQIHLNFNSKLYQTVNSIKQTTGVNKPKSATEFCEAGPMVNWFSRTATCGCATWILSRSKSSG
jgi:hypothetical protein